VTPSCEVIRHETIADGPLGLLALLYLVAVWTLIVDN
jgi:hypothetical protein